MRGEQTATFGTSKFGTINIGYFKENWLDDKFVELFVNIFLDLRLRRRKRGEMLR